MEANTNLSQDKAPVKLELSRMRKMKKPHRAIKERNIAYGPLAVCLRPRINTRVSKPTLKLASINGKIRYRLKMTPHARAHRS